MPEFPHSEPIEAEVAIPVGSIEVTAEERDSVHVEVTPLDDSEDSRAAAEATTVEFSKGKLKVEFPRNMFRHSPPAISVEAHIPASSKIKLRSATANIDCTGTFGKADINCASGTVKLGDVTGDTKIRTASGDIQTGETGGDLKVQSASGDIIARAVGGKAKTRSASGDIKVGPVGGDFEAESASGDVIVESLRSGKTVARTVSGDVSLGVVEGTGVWLDFSSLSGSINSGLEPVESSSDGHELSIHARTVSGDIAVKRAGSPAALAGYSASAQ